MDFYPKHNHLHRTTVNHHEHKLVQTSPPHLIIKTHHQPPPLPPAATQNSLRHPPSPESPWALSVPRSPVPTTHFPVQYHCVASLRRRDGNLYAVAVSNGFIFTGSDSKRIRVWKQPEFMERGSIKSNSGRVRTMLIFNNTIFTSHNDRKIRVWNFTVGPNNFNSKKITSLPKKSLLSLQNKKPRNAQEQSKHKDVISCMAFYEPDGVLYTGSLDKKVKAWKVSEKKCVDSFVAHDEGFLNGIVVNQEDGSVFTCASDGSVKIWRRVFKEINSSHTLTMTLRFQNSPVNDLALIVSAGNDLNRPNCTLYSGSSDGTISFWEKERLSSRFNHAGILQGHKLAVLCLVAMGRFLFSGSEDTTIRIWKKGDQEGGYLHECVVVLDGHSGPVRCLAACLDIDEVVIGFLVYSAGLDQSLRVWKVRVIPDEDSEVRACLDNYGNNSGVTDYEVSPVLSPSWVEKKLQGVHHPFE